MKKRMLIPLLFLAAASASCVLPSLATNPSAPDATSLPEEGTSFPWQGNPVAVLPTSTPFPTNTPIPTSTPVPTEAEKFVSNYGQASYDAFLSGASGLSPALVDDVLGIYNLSAPTFNDARESYGFPLDSAFSELLRTEDILRLIENYKAIGFKHGPELASNYVDQALALYGANPLEEQIVFLNGGQWTNGNPPPARAFLDYFNNEMLQRHSQDDITTFDLSGNPPSEASYSSYIEGLVATAEKGIPSAPSISGLGPSETLSQIAGIVAGNDFVDITLNLHGYTESFVLSGDANPALAQTTFQKLAGAIVEGYSQGNGGLDRLVVRLNECGGNTSVQNFATSLYSAFRNAGVGGESFPQIYIQISNDSPFGLTDLGAYSFGQIENWQSAPGITDFNWPEINSRGSANIYSAGSVLVSQPTDFPEKSIDLNVQTYQLTYEGALQKVPTESQVLLSPAYVGSYANP